MQLQIHIRPTRVRGFEMWTASLLLAGREVAQLTRWSEAQVRTDLNRLASKAGFKLELLV